MLIVYLAVGLTSGSAAALLSLLAGYSIWTAVGLYILACNLGALVPVLIAAKSRPKRDPQDGQTEERVENALIAPLRPAQRRAVAVSVAQLLPTEPDRPQIAEGARSERRARSRS
jgi:hypothetical protein